MTERDDEKNSIKRIMQSILHCYYSHHQGVVFAFECGIHGDNYRFRMICSALRRMTTKRGVNMSFVPRLYHISAAFGGGGGYGICTLSMPTTMFASSTGWLVVAP